MLSRVFLPCILSTQRRVGESRLCSLTLLARVLPWEDSAPRSSGLLETKLRFVLTFSTWVGNSNYAEHESFPNSINIAVNVVFIHT